MVIGYDELTTIAEYLDENEDLLATDLDLEPRQDGWWLDLSDGPCPFLRSDRCSIHQVKPRQCRTYPFWPEIVESERSWQKESRVCPGIGRGPVWPADKVNALLKELDPERG